MTESDYNSSLDSSLNLSQILTIYENRFSKNNPQDIIEEKYRADSRLGDLDNYRSLQGLHVNHCFMGPRESLKLNALTSQIPHLFNSAKALFSFKTLSPATFPFYPTDFDIATIQALTQEFEYRSYQVLNESRQKWYG